MNATGVTACPAESNGKLLLGIWRHSLHVTCGLTACTPGSAAGPTLGNECGKTLPFYPVHQTNVLWRQPETEVLLEGSYRRFGRLPHRRAGDSKRPTTIHEKTFEIGEYFAKLQARARLSHAVCAPGICKEWWDC